jgi:hypothetical protein
MTTLTLGNGQILTNPVITSGNTDLQGNGIVVTLQGTLDDAGTYAMASTGNNTDLILDTATVSFAGGGVIEMSDATTNRIYGEGASVLINSDTIAGAGQLGIGLPQFGLALTNAAAGIIDATGTAALIVQPGVATIANDGLMEATGSGGLVITGTVTLDQTGGTLLAAGAGDNIYLEDDTGIAGGLLQGTGGGLIVVMDASLDGLSNGVLTIAGGSTVQVSNSRTLDLLGTIANHGTIDLDATASATDLVISSPTVSLLGGGVILLAGNGDSQIFGAGTADVTLINVNNTILGAGQLGTGGANPLAFTNGAQGVIDADASAPIVIQPGGTSALDVNDGLIEATGTGGLEITDGATIIQHGGTLLAKGTGAVIYLLGGADIAGGLLLTKSHGQIRINGDVTLDGAAAGALTIGASSTVTLLNSSHLDVLGKLDIAGTLSMASIRDATDLILAGDVRLTGGGVLDMSDNSENQIFGSSTALDVLVNVDDTIAGAGRLGDGSGATPLALTNAAAGVIDADGATIVLEIDTGGPALVNDGLLEANNTAGLVLAAGSVVEQRGGGEMLANGAGDDVYMQGATNALTAIEGGLLQGNAGGSFVVSGAVKFDGAAGAVTIGMATTVLVGDGAALGLAGTIDNLGTLSVVATGDATGLAIDGANVTLTGGGVVLLSGTGGAGIFAGTAGSSHTLVNVNDTIAGAGSLGGALTPLTLTNQAHGVIEAIGGTLDAAGGIGGSGKIVIEAGAAFELGESSKNAVVFAPPAVLGGSLSGALLILDEASAYTGVLTSLAAGDTIDLANTLASSATITHGELVVTLTAGGTLSYNLAGTAPHLEAAASSDDQGGTDITFFVPAAASPAMSFLPPSPETSAAARFQTGPAAAEAARYQNAPAVLTSATALTVTTHGVITPYLLPEPDRPALLYTTISIP